MKIERRKYQCVPGKREGWDVKVNVEKVCALLKIGKKWNTKMVKLPIERVRCLHQNRD